MWERVTINAKPEIYNDRIRIALDSNSNYWKKYNYLIGLLGYLFTNLVVKAKFEYTDHKGYHKETHFVNRRSFAKSNADPARFTFIDASLARIMQRERPAQSVPSTAFRRNSTTTSTTPAKNLKDREQELQNTAEQLLPSAKKAAAPLQSYLEDKDRREKIETVRAFEKFRAKKDETQIVDEAAAAAARLGGPEAEIHKKTAKINDTLNKPPFGSGFGQGFARRPGESDSSLLSTSKLSQTQPSREEEESAKKTKEREKEIARLQASIQKKQQATEALLKFMPNLLANVKKNKNDAMLHKMAEENQKDQANIDADIKEFHEKAKKIGAELSDVCEQIMQMREAGAKDNDPAMQALFAREDAIKKQSEDHSKDKSKIEAQISHNRANIEQREKQFKAGLDQQKAASDAELARINKERTFNNEMIDMETQKLQMISSGKELNDPAVLALDKQLKNLEKQAEEHQKQK